MVKNPVNTEPKWTVAKSDDATVQITLTIPWENVEKPREEAIDELAKEVEVPGFRKGMAPRDKAVAKIPPPQLIEKTLGKILPKLISDIFDQEKLKPIIYPRFELLKALENQDWEVRAVTCEMPQITLGDYKKAITGALRAKNLWTPEKGKKDTKPKELTQTDREQIAIKTILETAKVTVPKILIEEEVNARLASLLERIEKLGLKLESYLASLGKTPETLRVEYEKQAEGAIALEFILGEIARIQGTKIDPKEVDKAAQASQVPADQKGGIENMLLKRAVIQSLASLA